MAVPSPSKHELRRQSLASRRTFARTLAPHTRTELEAALAERVLSRLGTARVIGGYHALADEIDPAPLHARAAAAGRTIALPWFADRRAQMLFRAGAAGEAGPWKVPQPPAAAEAVRPDLLLVPLVLADRQGRRIGRGKGHYDRAIAALRAGGPLRTIGLGWDMQIVGKPLPSDPWDERLDAIATPGEWIDCR
ncbi:MAG: 5-formyltetrahydrofolate cyclo-ligase [Sphingomonadaceae bacterium]